MDDSPFAAPLPVADHCGSRWVRPELVVDVRSLGDVGHNTDGRLRQPVFTALRVDLSATDLADLTGFGDVSELGGTDD